MRMNKARRIGYWATTVVLGFVWISGGGADLIHRGGTEGGMVALGYPTYVMTILGFWKIMGALAILAPGFRLVKEWAYAGTFFELTGAFASHLAKGSPVSHLIYTGAFALCAVASWALRPADRMLDIPGLRRLRPNDDHASVPTSGEFVGIVTEQEGPTVSRFSLEN